jgi:cell wall-associated NlpC family hydrolase
MADLHRVSAPVLNILDAPNGALQRQMLFGDGFVVDRINDGWAYGRRERDDYVGVVAASDLAGWADPTAYVRDLGAHVYPMPDIKTVPLMHLPYQAGLTVVGEQGEFAELAAGGFVHQMQIAPISDREPDILRTAERYLGVPYLWGGNAQYGIDCSGLVSAALRGAGVNGPADSGPQEAGLGETIPTDAPLARGDLIFWRGHVGLMYSPDLLLHANGHHMRVAFEPLEQAEERIFNSGGGPVTARKRLAI